MRYSGITTYLNCPKKYEFEYVKELKSLNKSIDLEFGTTIHTAIECAFEGLNPVAVFRNEWLKLENEEMKKGKYSFSSLLEMGERFMSNFEERHLKHLEPLYLEKEFQFDNEGTQFSGTIDFVGHYKGVPSIVDWKTSDKAYDKIKIDSFLQLYIYSLASETCFGFLPEQIVYFVFVKSEAPRIQALVKKIDKDLLRFHNKNAIEIVRNIDRGVFYKNYNHCGFCDFKKECWG